MTPLERIAYLQKTLNYHNEKYYNQDSPEISDFEYDALLRELDKLIEKETKIPVHVAPYPMDCVAAGMGMCLEKGNI